MTIQPHSNITYRPGPSRNERRPSRSKDKDEDDEYEDE